MSFENGKYSVDKESSEWCLRQSKRLKAIDPQMKIQMRNHKHLKKIPGELDNAIKCRCNQSCTLDDIANALQDVKKRRNIGKYSPYKSSSFKEKQPFRVEIKDKPKERKAKVTKKKNSCHNCGLLKILRKNGPAFSIGEEPLGKIRGYDTELYLNVERPYPPILRRPPYPESLETTKEIEKQINEPLDMDVIRKVGHNEMVEIVTPVLITWNDGKYRLFGDFRALNNYTKYNRYPIQSIPHALDQLEKAKHITKMDCMKDFHQNGVKPNSMKLLRIICHMGIYEYTRVPFGIKNSQLISKG
ncbi:hypothetical protein O181_020005 [Austropuccinia psidii MF-1]|uniref:Reverse transcriptase domain-containing protein n=1 Tax=Austropuccinia psidii MF-1 TaxID=1389203 RepID=A0A9Q3CBT2_9BASI|nr:hypothetical protein [Austropuccinia psidii MF-1]